MNTHVHVLPSSSLASGGLSTGFQSAAASTITSSTSRPRLKHMYIACVGGGGREREGQVIVTHVISEHYTNHTVRW